MAQHRASVNAPIVTTTRDDDVGFNPFGATQGGSLPKTDVNMAEHPLIKGQVEHHIYPLLERAEMERAPLEEEWRRILRMEHMIHDQGRKYFGRHDAYLPLWSRIKKVLVSQITQGMFPSDEYMDILDRQTGDPEVSRPVKTYVQWELENNARLRQNVKPGVAQMVSFGNFPAKHWYKKAIRYEGRAIKRKSAMGTQVSLGYGPVQQDGFQFRSPSIFNMIYWPLTAQNIDEVQLISESIDIPVAVIHQMIKAGEFLNGNAAMDAPEPTQHRLHLSELHQEYFGVTPPQASSIAGNPLGSVRTLREVFCCIQLPDEVLEPGEDPDAFYPVRLMLAGSVPVVCRRNGFLDQRAPHELLTANATQGMLYGYGEGKLAMPTQLLANDTVNQTADVGEYCNNPIMLVNTNMVNGRPPPLAPGRMYPGASNDFMSFIRPPIEMVEYGAMLLNMWASQTQDNSGAPPQVQGVTGGVAKTATQAQILQRNAMQPLQDQVEDIELGILIPTMRACWIYGQQYREDPVFAAVMGQQPQRIEPWMLVIDPEFRWLASSQALNQAQRTQNLIQMIQMVGPYIQYLNQMGYVVDLAPMLNRLYSDGFGLRGFDQFIRKMAPAQPNWNGMGNGPMSSGEQMQMNANDRARSALEQTPGGEVGMPAAPGEAEDFMDVRQNADQIAGMLGGQGGGTL